MAEGEGAESGEQVEIVAPFCIPDGGALGPPFDGLEAHELEEGGEAGVDVPAVALDDLSGIGRAPVFSAIHPRSPPKGWGWGPEQLATSRREVQLGHCQVEVEDGSVEARFRVAQVGLCAENLHACAHAFLIADGGDPIGLLLLRDFRPGRGDLSLRRLDCEVG